MFYIPKGHRLTCVVHHLSSAKHPVTLLLYKAPVMLNQSVGDDVVAVLPSSAFAKLADTISKVESRIADYAVAVSTAVLSGHGL